MMPAYLQTRKESTLFLIRMGVPEQVIADWSDRAVLEIAQGLEMLYQAYPAEVAAIIERRQEHC